MFNASVYSKMNDLECGMTKTLIGNILASALNTDAQEIASRRTRSKKGTIIDALENQINIAI